jgi:hypothetical protein
MDEFVSGCSMKCFVLRECEERIDGAAALTVIKFVASKEFARARS